jgi:hypothetical protein
MSHEHMPTVRVPARGSIVVYADGSRPDGHQRFRLGDVVGPAVEDPISGRTWLGVLLPDRPDTIDLVDLGTVVNIVPPA